jgi:hypothetical protein
LIRRPFNVASSWSILTGSAGTNHGPVDHLNRLCLGQCPTGIPLIQGVKHR